MKADCYDFRGALADLKDRLEEDSVPSQGRGHRKKKNHSSKVIDWHAEFLNMDLLRARARAKFEHRDFSGAIADWTECLKSDPEDSMALLRNRGMAKIELADHSGALTDLTESLRLNPEHPETLRLRGCTWFGMREYSNALADFAESLKSDPQNALALRDRAVLKGAMQDNNGALADCNAALKISPKDANVFMCRAHAKYCLGNLHEARADCTKALEIEPTIRNRTGTKLLDEIERAILDAESKASAAASDLLLEEESFPSQAHGNRKKKNRRRHKKSSATAVSDDLCNSEAVADAVEEVGDSASFRTEEDASNNADTVLPACLLEAPIAVGAETQGVMTHQHDDPLHDPVSCNLPKTDDGIFVFTPMARREQESLCEADTTKSVDIFTPHMELNSISENIHQGTSSASTDDNPQQAADSHTRDEIVQLFQKLHLSLESAKVLTDPEGDYDYADLVQFVENVEFEDLRAAGLKVAGARQLLNKMKPGGEVYNQLVIAGRLVPTKCEPPKLGRPAGASNHGSSASDITGSSSSGRSTQFTEVQVRKRVKERVKAVESQLYEQDKLSEICGQPFSTLNEACQVSRAKGVISDADDHRLRLVNHEGNLAKHSSFGQKGLPQ